jgi:hypothetical protein
MAKNGKAHMVAETIEPLSNICQLKHPILQGRRNIPRNRVEKTKVTGIDHAADLQTNDTHRFVMYLWND